MHHYGIVKKEFCKARYLAWKLRRRNCEIKFSKIIFALLISNLLIKKRKVIVLSYADEKKKPTWELRA